MAKRCVAVFQGKLEGSQVLFFQQSASSHVRIEWSIVNLKPGLHGFHVHEKGDLRQSCKSCQGHWNPRKKDHGGRHDTNSHAGDLGNILANDKGVSRSSLETKKLTLFGKHSIVGRSIIVHEDPDDLGRGENKASKVNGNAGARLDCAVIGIR